MVVPPDCCLVDMGNRSEHQIKDKLWSLRLYPPWSKSATMWATAMSAEKHHTDFTKLSSSWQSRLSACLYDLCDGWGLTMHIYCLVGNQVEIIPYHRTPLWPANQRRHLFNMFNINAMCLTRRVCKILSQCQFKFKIWLNVWLED